jgi:hypothetical protein
MLHRDKVALVSGMALGLWGGALGTFVLCTVTRAVTYRLLSLLNEQYRELRLPATPVRQLVGDQSSRAVPIASHG